jgi:hypothetical protein
MATYIRALALAGAAMVCLGPPLSMPGIAQTEAHPTPVHPSVPTLHLSDAQREQIRAAVSQESTDVSFDFKESKGAKSFVPARGAKLPKGVTPHALPQPLIHALPVLREFKYVKFKDQVLIVNPVTEEIVDLFPLT